MMACPSDRLNITLILCFIDALQCIFSRYLIVGYPREKRGSAENQHGTGKGRKAIEGGLQTENFFLPPPTHAQGGRKSDREK